MSLILIVIGLALLKYGMSLAAIICIAVAFFVCILNVKKKGVFNIICLILSGLLLVFLIYVNYTYTNHVKKSIDSVKTCAKGVGTYIERNASSLILNEYVSKEATGEFKYVEPIYVELPESSLKLSRESGCSCTGYVTYYHENNDKGYSYQSKAYVHCDNYITEGYNSSYDKMLK